ncbi:MAG TPA: hypothetical protein VJS66_02205 [Burkholderiales bacterium]|nr:hypothetical protein [Burkholderiales bacterium]
MPASIATSVPRLASATGPIGLEVNYIAKPRANTMPSAATNPDAGGGPSIAIELNYIASQRNIPNRSGTPAVAGNTQPINVEVNYIARSVRR